MKNLIRIPLTLTLLFATCCLCLGQEFYRGELFVTGQHFSLTNGHLNVELSVDFEGLRMPSDESLTVTPVLKNGEYEQELPAVLINGAEKQKVYQRTQALAAGKRNNAKVRTSPIPAVVIRNDHAASRAFTYKVSVPYEQWMERAILLLRSQECACHGKKGDVYEDKIADGIRLPKMRVARLDADIDAEFLSLVNFIQPAPDKDTLHCITGSVPYFELEGEQKNGKQLGELSEEKQNFEIYYRLRDALRDLRQERGTELTKVSVTGYGVPAGNLKKNEANALIRALKLKEYLRENRLAGRALLEVHWIPEDWDSITSLVRRSDMLLREAVLDLINNVRDIKILEPDNSVCHELMMIKVAAKPEQRQGLISIADVFHAKVADVSVDSMILEMTGNHNKLEAFLELMGDYEILELARTGMTGLSRGSQDVTYF